MFEQLHFKLALTSLKVRQVSPSLT